MSPNEFQLRAALREGEGDGVDVDAVLANAAEIRRRRRRTVTSISSGVAVAAAVAVGSAVLVNLGGTGSGGGANVAAGSRSSAAGAPSTAASSAPRPQIVVPNGTRTQSKGGMQVQNTGPTSASCPNRPPRISAPAAGTSGVDGPLFPRPVATLTVCGYSGPVAPQTVRSTQVSGSTAAALAHELDQAGASGARTCAHGGRSDELVLYALAPDGTKLPPVAVSFGCTRADNTTATNGTAVRYGWTPPPWVLRLLGTGPPLPSISLPPDRVVGSPPRK